MLRGISLSGKTPKAIPIKNNTKRNQLKEAAAIANKKSRQRAKKDGDVLKLDGHSKKTPRKRITYIDECLKYHKGYQNMNALEQDEFYRELNSRIYNRSEKNKYDPDIVEPIPDKQRRMLINYQVLLRAVKIMGRSQLIYAEILAAFIDREDGVLRTKRNGCITLKEIAKVLNMGAEEAYRHILALDKLQVIHMESMGTREFEDIYRQEVEDEKCVNMIQANLSKREYRIYYNPFFVFVRQYIDKAAAREYFYGSDWGLYNNNYTYIKNWIEKNCE